MTFLPFENLFFGYSPGCWNLFLILIRQIFQKASKAAESEGLEARSHPQCLGIAVATMGPTAAMGVATTFGVASTGTAISALSGAAAN